MAKIYSMEKYGLSLNTNATKGITNDGGKSYVVGIVGTGIPTNLGLLLGGDALVVERERVLSLGFGDAVHQGQVEDGLRAVGERGTREAQSGCDEHVAMAVGAVRGGGAGNATRLSGENEASPTEIVTEPMD